ncbi:PH domain-containing protein [Cryobacterium sp. TMT1-21]|uniref:PH domain-containing protein n=1 Tax=Cryobacterium shii TaxID=1259235 RepID=A0AAQ2HEZ9_9MICO|nr:PH domain-containing protein [Cryobacterium shii]TFC89661.1 PH domain-containing protein [Cryobacterium sp. TmT2-59]TFD12003.1 PH domain-containing protein [Cryobacterium sp. TMT4-10]TFD16906.1 PH domain-containing protein [Cryobacterium sp. TMT1-21]TFD22883.1 PH domain-containing protein [Cryobacterium sp. TMT2-23]TFD44238.1 PH domain-containing protein [Cryobacterium sp. TMT2-10]
MARLRPHARVLFWPTLFLLAACGATGYYYGSLPEPWQNTALLAGAVAVVLLFWLLPLVSWLNHRYTITTRRIIFRRGVFVRTRQELLHSRGYDVTVRTTWLQSLVRSGDVVIKTGPEHPLVLKDVPNPVLVQQVLHDLMEQSRARVGTVGHDQSITADPSPLWGRR